jgi:transposase
MLVAMTSVPEKYQYVTGVDCHAAGHVFTVVESATGRKIDQASFPTSPGGLSRAVSWTLRHAPQEPLVVVEGIGSYGAGLAVAMRHAGLTVVEAEPVAPATRRGAGKSDELDSLLIARSVLGVDVERLRRPRFDEGIRDALRVLLTARNTMNGERTRCVNQLTALVRSVGLGVDARRRLTATQITSIAGWRTRNEALHLSTARSEAVRLAERIHALNADLRNNQTRLLDIVRASAYAILLTVNGVGPITAATLIVAWGTHDRIRSDAAFASLAGVNPVPASSGNTVRHRLNRSGDRQLNRAITVIATSRMRTDPTTRAYVARRTAEGLTARDVKRILKRYIVRQLYKILDNIIAA